MPAKLNLTPIERAIRLKTCRQARYEERLREQGILYPRVKCHQDDIEAVRRYAAELLALRVKSHD